MAADTTTRMRFFDLPLGTRFRYVNGDKIWVVINRAGLGTVAEYLPPGASAALQQIFTFADTEEECRFEEVYAFI